MRTHRRRHTPARQGARGPRRVARTVPRFLTVAALLALCTGAGSPAPAAPAPKSRCTVSDPRLGELSGLASGGDHWYAVPDGGSRLRVYRLGRDCGVLGVRTADIDPYDVEDLARAADGTLWLADTGDNERRRDTVAVQELRPDGAARLHRLTYPDGPHDAEAMVLGDGDAPFVFTKTPFGDVGVYTSAGPLRTPGPTPLRKVASLSLSTTDTPGGPVGSIGSVLVTGAARSFDGRVLAVRTYTDVYLYPVRGDDVAAALSHKPVRVPLPGETQGEAVAFEPDGTLLSAGEGKRQPIRALPGAAGLVSGRAPNSGNPANSGNSANSGDGGSAVDKGPGSEGVGQAPGRESRTGGANGARADSARHGLPAGPAILVSVGVVLAGWLVLRWVRALRKR